MVVSPIQVGNIMKHRVVMNQKSFESIALIIGILILGFLGLATWGILIAILIVCLILIHAIPNKYTPHVATLEFMVVAGGLVALLFLLLFKTVPTWFAWVGVVWLAISLATSMVLPFRFLKRAEEEGSMWPLATLEKSTKSEEVDKPIHQR